MLIPTQQIIELKSWEDENCFPKKMVTRCLNHVMGSSLNVLEWENKYWCILYIKHSKYFSIINCNERIML